MSEHDYAKIKIKKITVRHPTARELFKKRIPMIEMFRTEHQIIEVEFESPNSNPPSKG